MSDQTSTTQKLEAALTTPAATVVVAPKETEEARRQRWLSEARCPECGKPVMKPRDGGLGSTCFEHQGKLRSQADQASTVPEGWLRMSDVCRKAVSAGLTISAIVNAAGGDAATKPVLHPCFRVVYVGRGKWMSPDVLTVGFDLLKNKPKAEPKVQDQVLAPKSNPTANALKDLVHQVKK